MKKPLLFSLLVWLVLLALPWTRGQTRLDWRAATLERLRDFNPAWAPLDQPYQPEKFDVESSMGLAASLNTINPDMPADVQVNGLSVAPQFASIARSSTERDVLVWCASSAQKPESVTRNSETLSRRFPQDVELLAWACGAQMNSLSLSTRFPGPLSSPLPNWSVQTLNTMGGIQMKIDLGARPKWDALALQARRGQRMEPRNVFWWWLEAATLLGARHDERVWAVLRAGSSKPLYDDHSRSLRLATYRAHLHALGTIPPNFLLNSNTNSYIFTFLSRWREATRQVCENIIGARFAERHKTALEGGRDIMLMGRTLRLSNYSFSVTFGGISIEAIALQNALPPSASTFKFLRSGSSVQALAGHPRSLLRYANEQHRSDIVSQITTEWQALSKARAAQMAKLKVSIGAGSSIVEGVNDTVIIRAAGTQNTGALLVQTLPIPILALAVLSLLSLVFRRRSEEIAVPAWTRGLGWSAFALLVLFGAQTMLSHVAWQFVGGSSGMGTATPWGFDFILPRLVTLLPVWVFGFAACVALVGALWTTTVATRRERGDASLLTRLGGMLRSPDDRTGTLDLSPILQLIALVGIWVMAVAALAAWFFFPQQGALEEKSSDTLHDTSAGLALAVFCIAASIPTLLFRVKGTRLRPFFAAWLHITRRFLAAHIALATLLYLLLAIGSAFFGARFDADWLRVNAPQTTTQK